MISNQRTCKTYTVTVCIEVSAQFEVTATSVKNAKAKARELAENSIEVIFDGNCLNPDVDYQRITDDMVEE